MLALAAFLIASGVATPRRAVVSAFRRTMSEETVTYRLQPLRRGLKELRTGFDGAQLALLQKLNRVDLDHLARLGYIVVPDRWDADELTYSPLPLSYAWAESRPKALVVYQPAQVFGAYEYGRLVRWGPISSGRREAPTPEGLLSLNWKSKGRTSTFDPEWFMPWYFNFGSIEGLSFHEHQLPGRPASHACVRLLAVDARWLYDWGQQWQLDASGRVWAPGTPVLVLGTFDFGASSPWRSMEFLARPIDLPADPFPQSG
ncbi:MAG: hypothetical protein A3H95_02870 [Acidobacteria bacterium RIFCSPLOWO2_02_FULL_64_15]|nr:MAG: hypothetical protein A3H95_02870 [Acidobacteria bacterium RIFCSPLOWO2_02_FULL_64_15]